MYKASQLTLSLTLIFTCCALAGCEPAASTSSGEKIDVGDDAKLWQGGWKLVSVSWNGKPDHLDDAHWVVDGDKYGVVVGGKALEQGNKFTLDSDKKRVDVFHHRTPKGTFGGSLKGIYEVSQDRLRVVYDPTARVYPASFDPTPGAKFASFVFERDSN